MASSYDELRKVEQACVRDGLLKPGFGGLLRITKKGRDFVRQAADSDEEIVAALRDALESPLLDRRNALASVVLLVRQRHPI